jgi:ribosome biogenesis GTPase
MTLTDLGWDEYFERHARECERPDLAPARVVAEHRALYRVHTGAAEMPARATGALRHHAASRADLPAVGDWVLIQHEPPSDVAVIHHVVPRRTKFSRKAAGARVEEQIVAANVDTVWIVSSLAGDLNLRRLERYLALAWESGASPAIVLSKMDLCSDLENTVSDVETAARGAPVHTVSCVTGHGLDDLTQYLTAHRTVALLGSSGVGKSTLINKLLGEDVLRTGAVRTKDGKGMHVTRHRQLLFHPSGGMIVDTPGMRELQLWEASEGMGETFADIEEAAASCRFVDCRHMVEPGCAVVDAVQRGQMDAERLASYHKLQQELRVLERKTDARARADEKQRVRVLMKSMRRHPKYRR